MSSTKEVFKSGEARGTGAAKADQWIDSAKGKTNDAAQSTRESKEETAGFLQQTGEQVKCMAQNAAEAVKNAVGMGDSNQHATTHTTTTTTRK